MSWLWQAVAGGADEEDSSQSLPSQEHDTAGSVKASEVHVDPPAEAGASLWSFATAAISQIKETSSQFVQELKQELEDESDEEEAALPEEV